MTGVLAISGRFLSPPYCCAKPLSRRWRTMFASTALLGLTVMPTLSPAQLAPAQENAAQSVRDRPKADYDALGIRAGSFLLYPQLTSKLVFDSNVFALPPRCRPSTCSIPSASTA